MSARTAGLTALALVAFAANSLLCRAALRPGLVDAASFTAVRLVSGAVALVLLSAVLASGGAKTKQSSAWLSAAALAAYAIAFSFAYLRLDAGVGALTLFGAVQASMIGWGVVMGDRPRPREWIGLALALAGLTALARPGRAAPDPIGLGLMALAGIAWAVYTLRGRGAADAIAANARSFLLATPLALAACAVAWGSLRVDSQGIALAAASGAVASGLGYCVWYAALRGLSATQAAVVQLAVPVLAALGGIVLLGEVASPRLLACGLAILSGIALAVIRRPS